MIYRPSFFTDAVKRRPCPNRNLFRARDIAAPGQKDLRLFFMPAFAPPLLSGQKRPSSPPPANRHAQREKDNGVASKADGQARKRLHKRILKGAAMSLAHKALRIDFAYRLCS